MGTHQPFPVRDAPTKQRPFPHRGFCCPVGSGGTTAASDALPARSPLPGSSPVIGRDAPATPTHAGHRAGEGLPSSRRHRLCVPSPHTPGGSSGLQSRLYTPSMAFAVTGAARLLLSPPAGGVLTTRQASLDASDRSVAPPVGLSTLRFDPGRFPPRPAACYRASWQLPGPDLPRLAATSLCWISYP
jgi:hypothetical protein